jgi:hypothetical protein
LAMGNRTHVSNPLAARRKQESLKSENCINADEWANMRFDPNGT